MIYGQPADEMSLIAYTNGKAPDQFVQPRVGSRSSLLVQYFLKGLYIVLANSEDPDQTARSLFSAAGRYLLAAIYR